MKNFIKITSVIISVFSIYILFFSVQTFAGEMSLHAVYVGRGDAIIISSNNHYMLVDSGTGEGSSLLMKYLDRLNIPDKKIDYVVSTHPDGDHVGGFPAVLEQYQIGQVFYSPCTKANNDYYHFINTVKEHDIPFRNPVDGDTWKLGDATVSVVYDGSQGSTYNECSIVLKVTCDGKSMLLMGDLPSTMERELMEKGYQFRADILKVGHHGAAASSCADFLDAVKPQYAVISCSKDKNTNLPKPSVLMRLARRFVKTYRTTDGDVLIRVNNGKISTSNRENNGYQSIKNGTITLSNNVFYATGKEIRPTVTLFVNGIKIPSSHYTVKYSSNKATGFGTVKLTATEVKYVSTCKTTFMILPAKEKISGKLKGYKKINLSWSSQSKATGYTLQYSTEKDFSKNVVTKNFNHPSKTSVILKNLKTSRKYYIRIRAYKSNIGNGKWSKKICVETQQTPMPEKTEIIKLHAKGKNKIYISWQKISSKYKAGYQIQYSTSKKFTNGKKITTITYKKTKKTYRTIRGLKKNKVYYVRIRGYNKFGTAKWSPIKKVRTKKR